MITDKVLNISYDIDFTEYDFMVYNNTHLNIINNIFKITNINFKNICNFRLFTELNNSFIEITTEEQFKIFINGFKDKSDNLIIGNFEIFYQFKNNINNDSDGSDEIDCEIFVKKLNGEEEKITKLPKSFEKFIKQINESDDDIICTFKPHHKDVLYLTSDIEYNLFINKYALNWKILPKIIINIVENCSINKYDDMTTYKHNYKEK